FGRRRLFPSDRTKASVSAPSPEPASRSSTVPDDVRLNKDAMKSATGAGVKNCPSEAFRLGAATACIPEVCCIQIALVRMKSKATLQVSLISRPTGLIIQWNVTVRVSQRLRPVAQPCAWDI